ncbi:HYR domain-containing protein, partial [archaeon]
DPLTYNQQGTYTITWTFNDGNGNSSTATQTVVVDDVTAPVLTCPENITVTNDNNVCGATVTFAATATDNCTGTIVTYSKNPGTLFPIGTTTVTATATDIGGNVSTCTFTVTVNDTQAPVITMCTTNKSVYANTAVCSYTKTGTDWDIKATDNCNVSSFKYTLSGATSGQYTSLNSVVFNKGITTVSAMAYDASNNGSTACNFTVTVSSTLMVNVTNNNPDLYYGYSGDQSSTITIKPTGGVGPYKVTVTMNRPLICNAVTTSGDEMISAGAGTSSVSNTSCPTSGASTPGNPTLTANSVTTAGYSFNVTLMNDATFTVTITDALGCTTQGTTSIHADDVRCFAGNSGNAKVTICHRTGNAKNPCVTICVDQDAVAEHMAHGDFLGTCPPNCLPPAPKSTTIKETITTALVNEVQEVDKLTISAMPNPAVTHFTLKLTSNNKQEPIAIKVYNTLGQLMDVRRNLFAGQSIQIGAAYKHGSYFVEATQGTQRQQLQLVKSN